MASEKKLFAYKVDLLTEKQVLSDVESWGGDGSIVEVRITHKIKAKRDTETGKFYLQEVR